MPTMTLREIGRMPIAERILLAEKIWETIPEDADSLGLAPSQKKELSRRLARLESGQATTVPWSSIKSRLRIRRLCK